MFSSCVKLVYSAAACYVDRKSVFKHPLFFFIIWHILFLIVFHMNRHCGGAGVLPQSQDRHGQSQRNYARSCALQVHECAVLYVYLIITSICLFYLFIFALCWGRCFGSGQV